MTPDSLRHFRTQRLGWTQERLARLLGVDRVTLARWETGTRPLPPFLHFALEYLAEHRSTFTIDGGRTTGRGAYTPRKESAATR